MNAKTPADLETPPIVWYKGAVASLDDIPLTLCKKAIMAPAKRVVGIDPDSWQVTILPLPNRFTRGGAYGFCNG